MMIMVEIIITIWLSGWLTSGANVSALCDYFDNAMARAYLTFGLRLQSNFDKMEHKSIQFP